MYYSDVFLDILGSPQTLLLLHHLYHYGVGSGQFQTSALCLQSVEDGRTSEYTTVACSVTELDVTQQ